MFYVIFEWKCVQVCIYIFIKYRLNKKKIISIFPNQTVFRTVMFTKESKNRNVKILILLEVNRFIIFIFFAFSALLKYHDTNSFKMYLLSGCSSCTCCHDYIFGCWGWRLGGCSRASGHEGEWTGYFNNAGCAWTTWRWQSTLRHWQRWAWLQRETDWEFRFDLNNVTKVLFLEDNYWLWFRSTWQKIYFRFAHLCDSECGSVNSLGLESCLCTGLHHMWTEHGAKITIICLVWIHHIWKRSSFSNHTCTVFLNTKWERESYCQ